MKVGELAKLYGINRQSVYKRINKGELSKDAEGLIDFAEAIRVFGEPSGRGVPVTQEQSSVTHKNTESYTTSVMLEMMQKQIERLEEDKLYLKEQLQEKANTIHFLQTLLAPPKQTDPSEKVEVATQEESPQVLSAAQPTETTLFSGKEQSNTEQKPRKKGLFGRVINAVFDNGN